MLEKLSAWPSPPNHHFAHVERVLDVEDCQLYLMDGRKMLGQLHAMTAAGHVIFTAINTEVSENFPLNQIRAIRLLNAVSLHKAAADNTSIASTSSIPQLATYRIEFSDHQRLHGSTLGHIETDDGVYLYFPKENNKVQRCLMPKCNVSHFEVELAAAATADHATDANAHAAVSPTTNPEAYVMTQSANDHLTDTEITTRTQLEQALARKHDRPFMKLGEALQELGLISQPQLESILSEQLKGPKKPLGQLLVEMGVLEGIEVREALAKKLGIPYVHLSGFNIDLNVIRLISVELAKKYRLMPLYRQGAALVVAFEDPFDMRVLDEVRFSSQLKLIPVMSSMRDIDKAIRQYYQGQAAEQYTLETADVQPAKKSERTQHGGTAEVKINELASRLSSEDKAFDLTQETVTESDNVLVQFVNKMITDAYQSGVSDIHIETYPGKSNTRIRFRKDGSLADYIEIPANFREAIISRIKVMAQMDIANRRRPQDGKIDFQHFGPLKIELRVVTIPTSTGLEDIVMRLLAAAKPLPMHQLGFAPDILDSLKNKVEHPYGLILVCGPTGSGKTTTLHSMLGDINTPDRKIWTVEDPVEITQPGLRQVQVNNKIDLNFASVIRSFLRADPDVIMVGEMRDQETTKAAIEASLTGHLVLSTLHTNTAPESVIRLLDLGMDPFNFADALLAVLAQRLAKGLCAKCKVPYVLDDAALNLLLEEYCLDGQLDKAEVLQDWQHRYAVNGELRLYKATGCKQCFGTGYKGRVGLHELMTVSAEVRHLIQTRAPLRELQHAALQAGMRTLKQDGMAKMLQGLTDMSQVRAVCS